MILCTFMETFLGVFFHRRFHYFRMKKKEKKNRKLEQENSVTEARCDNEAKIN